VATARHRYGNRDRESHFKILVGNVLENSSSLLLYHRFLLLMVLLERNYLEQPGKPDLCHGFRYDRAWENKPSIRANAHPPARIRRA
jgi:hypothetical protein